MTSLFLIGIAALFLFLFLVGLSRHEDAGRIIENNDLLYD